MNFYQICPRFLFVVTVVGVLALCASAVPAITINLSYDTPADAFPGYDPDGSKLQMICTAAANTWKDLLPFSNNSYSVTVHWEKFDANSTQLAVYNDFDHTIRVRTNITWFIDPTPTESSEFAAFQQELYRDLGFSQAAAFNGSVPPLLETGYTAKAVTGGVADNSFDMLSVLTHEMGHFTEIGWNLLKPDVDLPPSMLGWTTGVSVKREDESHILPDKALMDPFIAMNTRIMPSALDVLVAAHEQNHSQVLLKRVDWLGNSLAPASKAWFDSLAWEGGRAPISDTAVTIRKQAEVQVSSVPAAARTLLVAEDSTLAVLDNTLSVGLDTNVTGVSLYDHPKIRVHGGAALAIDRNLVVSLGSLEMMGGTASIGGLLVLDKEVSGADAYNLSALRGFGSVQIGAELRNRSKVAGENGTLTISAGAGATLDLDGNQEATSPGHIDAKIGNLFFLGPLHDDFNGNALIAAGHSIGFAEQFSFGAVSSLNFIDSGALAEFYSSSPTSQVTFNGANIDTAADSTTQIRAHKISLVNIAEARVKGGSVLSLKGNIEYSGGNFKGSGTLQQNGDAAVVGDTMIATAQYDWDGFNLPAYANTTVAANAKFSLVVDGFGVGGTYNGRTDLNNHAELSVDIQSGFGVWMLGKQGSIRFVENARLKGSPVIVTGALEAIEGSNHVDAPATLTGLSTVTVHDKASLSFHDHVVYGGGNISTVSGGLDDSELQQYSTANVLGHHRITVGFFHWDADSATDSHTTIQPNGFLDIRAKEIGNGSPNFFLRRTGFGNTIDMNGGKLSVVVGYEQRDAMFFPAYWTLNKTGVLNLNPGEHSPPVVLGSKLINNGVISGAGTFENPVENNAEIRVGHPGALGLIQLMADSSQSGDGSMAFDLAGLNPAVEYDQIFHGANLQLAGTLDVALLGQFAPSMGDTFRIIDGNPLAPLTGTFNTAHLPPGNWDVMYGSYFVDLRFTAVPEPNTLLLLAVCAAGFLAYAWRSRRLAR